MQKKLQIEYRKVNDIIPYIGNPRKNDAAVDKVASSIKNFGFKNPIIIDKGNEIIAGHTRLKAAKKLGLEEVPTIRAEDLDENQVKAFRIADNKTAELSDWDLDSLKVELDGLEDEFTGFDDDELDKLFGDDSEPAEEDNFEVEEPETPISEPGDIWLLGRHKVMCGDSTKEEDVGSLMGNNMADMFLSDPPYNVGYKGKTKDSLQISNDNMDDNAYMKFLAGAFKSADKVLKPGGVFYIWYADREDCNVRNACAEAGWIVRQTLIWNKNSIVMGWSDYQMKHEPCYYGWKSGAKHLWAADRKQTTVIDCARPTKSTEHPTMKPVALFDYQIKNNTKGNDIVLDPFMGSGTTVIACEQDGRTAYGLELDPKYTDVIVNRYINFKENDSDVYLLRNGRKILYRDLEGVEPNAN